MLINLSLPMEKPSQEETSARHMNLFKLGHYGTHLDRLLDSEIPLEYFKSRAILFDISDFSGQRPVKAEDISPELAPENAFLLFRTGALQRNPYASKEYMSEFIEFSWELLESLLTRNIRFIGVDARGLRRNEEHRQVDLFCEKAGTFVIENILNTQLLPEGKPFTLYTAWFDAGGSGLPCKLTAETD